MGLLSNDGAILIDSVLTSLGREFLARNDGSFEVVRFSFGDSEIDYSLFDPAKGTLQQDVDILNTPIFEASVDSRAAAKSQLISISNPDLKFLPNLTPNVSSISLGERQDAQVGKSVEFSQGTQSGRTVPSEIVDSSFLITVDNDLIFLEKQTPTNIDSKAQASYVVIRTALGSNQGAIVGFKVAVQALTSEIWDTLGTGTLGSRSISTKVRAQGALSGLDAEIDVTIQEQFAR